MKDKKIIIGIACVIILIFIICIVTKVKQNQRDSEVDMNTKTSYNTETGMYEIIDSNGNTLHSAYTEDDLYIDQIDPNYDAKSPSNDLENMD